MSNLIDRQAAIDVMCELMRHWFGGDPKDEIREIKRELEKLPSAQPVAKDINVPAKDCISRQAAIDAIESHIRTAEEPYQLSRADEVMNHAFEIAASCVYNLPSAQPEQPKKGKWIHPFRKKAYDRFCSECQKKCWYVGNGDYPFCPNCGADMRGDQNELN